MKVGIVFGFAILTLSVDQAVLARGVNTVGFGYSRLSVDGERGADLEGWGFACHFQFWPSYESEGFLVRLGVQGTWNNGDSDLDPRDILKQEKIESVDLITPQVEVGWHQKIGASIFIEPSVAVGWAIALYQPRALFEDEDIASGLAIRPGILIGLGTLGTNRPCFGIDMSYGLAQIDFEDEVGGNNHDFYVGAFLRF